MQSAFPSALPAALPTAAELSTYSKEAFVDAVAKAKPQGAKGTYIQRVALSSTMGPGVKVDPATVASGA
jgi:hypothetical protein